MASTTTHSPSVNMRLGAIALELDIMIHKQDIMSRKISIILDQTDRYFTDYYNNLYRVDVHCSRCTDISGEVVSLARVASNFENKITSSVQPTASFVPFARLPAELQVMIWEKAAQPPACPHYFSTFDPNRAGHDPAAAARLMADYGLWTANLSSRATMLRLYGKVFKNCDANKIQCHEICKNDELPSRQLGGYNRQSLAVHYDMRDALDTMRREVQYWDNALRIITAESLPQQLANIRRKFPCVFEEGGSLGDECMPINAMERLCIRFDEINWPTL